MGKSSISTAPFSIATCMLVYQRVQIQKNWASNPSFTCLHSDGCFSHCHVPFFWLWTTCFYVSLRALKWRHSPAKRTLDIGVPSEIAWRHFWGFQFSNFSGFVSFVSPYFKDHKDPITVTPSRGYLLHWFLRGRGCRGWRLCPHRRDQGDGTNGIPRSWSMGDTVRFMGELSPRFMGLWMSYMG